MTTTQPRGRPPRGDDEDLLDLAALLRDMDIIRRHREMTWAQVAGEVGLGGPVISGLLNGKLRPGLSTYQRLVRWVDPAARDYLLAGTVPARIPASDKVPPRYRQPAEPAASEAA